MTKKYISKDIRFNNKYSITEDYFDSRLKYYAYGHDIFHATTHKLIKKLKIDFFEDILCNYIYINYPESKLDRWIRSKRVWGDVKFITDGYLTYGYRRFRFFGGVLIHVEDYFLENKGISLEFLRDELFDKVDRDWDFRKKKWYDLGAVYPLSKTFLVHAFSPVNLKQYNNITKWKIEGDLIDNHL